MHGTDVKKNQVMHVVMVLTSARHTKTKDGCKLCSCRAIVNVKKKKKMSWMGRWKSTALEIICHQPRPQPGLRK